MTAVFVVFYGEWLYRWKNDRPSRRQFKPFPGKRAKARARAEAEALQLSDHMRQPSHAAAADVTSPGTDKDAPALVLSPEGSSEARYEDERPTTRRIMMMAIMIVFTTFLIIVRCVSL